MKLVNVKPIFFRGERIIFVYIELVIAEIILEMYHYTFRAPASS